MRKFAKFLIPALIVVAVVVSCMLMTTSAAGTAKVADDETVVFIANTAKGTGDGSSAENAMGHGAGYKVPDDKTYKLNAFYLALTANDSALIKNGGAIVICDEFTIDTCDAARDSFSEFQWPSTVGTKNITVTSYYDGVDYRATGAKLTFDTSDHGINLRIKAPTTWEFLNIETKYDSTRSYGKSLDSVIMLSFYGKTTVMGEELNMTANDIGGSEVYYPTLCGYDRMATGGDGTTVSDTNITINSGKYGRVMGTSYGLYAGGKQYGKMEGNVNITVNGGEVAVLDGVNHLTNASLTFGHKGNVNITLNGGKVGEVYGGNKNGTDGAVTVTISKTVTGIQKVWGYRYSGDDTTAPTESTINFDRSNCSESKVSYFKTVYATGVETLPPVSSDHVYISATGTGDGSSPTSPLGHGDTYYALLNSDVESDRNAAYKQNAFYRAFQKLATNGGTIVLVGDVAIESTSSRIPTEEGQKKAPAEMELPKANGEIVITSVYDGNDYRANAKLILDMDKCNVTFVDFKSAVTFEKLNIEHKYDPDDLNSWSTSGAFCARLNRFVIGAEVNVTSLNADTNAPGKMFPMIIGGNRYSKLTGNGEIVINSGTWDVVTAGGHGMSSTSSNYGTVTGNVKVTVNGGKIAKLYGTGSKIQPQLAPSLTGKVTMDINGGTIDELIVANRTEYLGTGSVITLGAGATLKYVDYAVEDYAGDLEDLKTRVTFVNNNSIVVGVKPPKDPVVIYIAANGTGDGSSPESPLGNAPGYAPGTNKQESKNALYRALAKIPDDPGIIVVVGDVFIDTAEGRVDGSGQSPAEFKLPKAGGHVLITSVYGGKDYRSNAKFVLDQAASAVTFLTFQNPTTFDNIVIEHRYDRNDANGWGTPMVLAAYGYDFTIGENTEVTAWDVNKNMKGNWYPAIIGGHRYLSVPRSYTVTVKTGNWDFVGAGSYSMTATYPGTVTGDVTLNIEGGDIGTIFGTTSPSRAYGSITGKLEINVTGGSADVLAIAGKNGAENEIVVNVAASADRVAKITGGTNNSNIPANLTVTYDRSVTRDDEVFYVNNLIATGDEASQPDPVVYRLYVANKEQGLGDGSSPENAMGHAPDYYEVRAKALAIIAANGGTNTGLTNEQKAVTGAVVPKNALYKALNQLSKTGGELIVCGSLTVDATDAMRRSLADFFCPTGTEHILITSYDSSTGIDYRSKGVRFVLDVVDLGLTLELGSPTTFDHITIEHRYNSKNGKGVDNGALIAARANKLVIGYDVYVWANDINPDVDARVDMYPSICGGHRYSDMGKGLEDGAPTHVTINAGNWAMVVGGAYTPSKVPHTGNATIGIDGSAKIETICGTTKATNGTKTAILDGSVWIGLWGGEVNNVYVVGKPGLKWGDASIGLGGTKINGKVRATHPDYEGEEIQAWVFNYTDKQIDTDRIIGFESPVPATGSNLGYLAIVAVVSLVGAVALIATKKKKIED